MTVLSITQAFQTANAGVSGVVSAPQPEDTPAQLNADMLPCAVTLPGAATWHGSGLGGGRKCRRTYACRYHVAPASADSETGAVMGDLLALLEATGTYWRAQRTIGGAMIQGVEDAGALRTLGYGGSQFFGFEVRVTVEEPA